MLAPTVVTTIWNKVLVELMFVWEYFSVLLSWTMLRFRLVLYDMVIFIVDENVEKAHKHDPVHLLATVQLSG